VGTELGLYRTTDGGQSWVRFGHGLPIVSVTEISVTLDSSAIRISTYGRGFWEIDTTSGLPAGVWGNGDMNRDQLIDGFDLVLQAAELWDTPSDSSYRRGRQPDRQREPESTRRTSPRSSPSWESAMMGATMGAMMEATMGATMGP